MGEGKVLSNASCSVVICTRNRPEQLDSCVRAVLRQCYSPFNVLIIDNASKDSQSFEVAARHDVRCILEPKVGCSSARNLGARESSADIVVYIDDDAMPEDGWLEGLCIEFRDPRVMGVAGRILPSAPHTEGARMCVAMGILDGGSERLVFDRDIPQWFDRARTGIGGGANMAIRRSAFSVWRGFEPCLGLGAILKGGDEDYAFITLIKSGYRIVYTPSAVVRHPFPETGVELRRKHLETLAISAAFLAFLFAQEPDCRTAILKHLLRRLPRSHRRSYRRAPAQAVRLAPLLARGIGGYRGFCAVRSPGA